MEWSNGACFLPTRGNASVRCVPADARPGPRARRFRSLRLGCPGIHASFRTRVLMTGIIARVSPGCFWFGSLLSATEYSCELTKQGAFRNAISEEAAGVAVAV